MKITLVSLLLLAGTVLAQTPTPTYSVKLTWTPPANATGIGGYVLYDRTSPILETSVAKVPANGQFVVVQLGVGMHRLTMASVTAAGEESARSNEARVTLPAPAPAPTGVAVSP
jgi:hypothetical protein